MYITIALLLLASHIALLPDILNGYQLLWLLWIVVPTVGITLLATPAASDLLHVPAPKNTYEENRNKMRFHLADIIVRFALFVPPTLVIFAWTFYAVWASQLPGELLNFSAVFGVGLHPRVVLETPYVSAMLLSQNVVLFVLVLFQAASSATSLHCTYDLLSTFKRVPNIPWLCSLLVAIVLQCAFFLISLRHRLDLIREIPWGVYVIAVLWLPVILVGQEIIKRRYSAFIEREEKWLREEFNTRLGMWSPKDV